MHSPDCALVQYANIDPATLKRPLECDGVECDGQDDGMPASEQLDEPTPIRPVMSGLTVTLSGDSARTFRALQAAEIELRQAQHRRDAALKAFTEAVTR